MNVRDLRASEVECVRQLLIANGWAHRVADAAAFARLIEKSQRTAVVEIDGEIVAFGRAITDGESNGYLSMIVVAAKFRRRGIGRALVEHLLRDTPSVTWVLRADRPDAAAFFERLGFARSSVAMERPRLQR